MELQLVCSYIGAAIQDPKTAKKAIASAAKIRLFKRKAEDKELPSVGEVMRALNG